jgi:hypothetical protein
MLSQYTGHCRILFLTNFRSYKLSSWNWHSNLAPPVQVSLTFWGVPQACCHSPADNAIMVVLFLQLPAIVGGFPSNVFVFAGQRLRRFLSQHCCCFGRFVPWLVRSSVQATTNSHIPDVICDVRNWMEFAEPHPHTFGPTDNFWPRTWYIDVSTEASTCFTCIFSLFSHCTHPSNVSNSNQSAIWSSLKLPRLVSCSILRPALDRTIVASKSKTPSYSWPSSVCHQWYQRWTCSSACFGRFGAQTIPTLSRASSSY